MMTTGAKTMDKNELKLVLQNHGLWLTEKGGEQADLRGADLRGARLRGADLRYARLSNADLSGADLRRADLSGADLSGADLRGADLRGARLRGADLSGADLRYADLSGADFSGADLSGADLIGANLKDLVGQIYITQRSDGYQYFAVLDDSVWMIRAGCRYMSATEYREHTDTYNCATKKAEVSAILDFAEAMIKIKEQQK
jgi:hypothetical protein